ncbi:hypothetical protein BDV93DRAFT_570176 [Ceratobasidium sp. AG-I]|nr:hypothetical protein BDV93DRAFT_516309 [Ceratobasidium sp. AG-I]KAF8605596.1 hypothetical protein BDV93DRAFT_570176 [Ceratobasidium sp. AG-I]
MTFSDGQYYAVYFELEDSRKQQQEPLNALGQWQDKSGAEVKWHLELKRLPDNRVVHFATPIVTCYRYYGPSGLQGAVLQRAAGCPAVAAQHTEEAVKTWLGQRGETLYRLVHEEDNSQQFSHAQFSTARISCVSYLNNLAVAGCQGEGYTQKEAKNAAAMLLFSAGYCVAAAKPNLLSLWRHAFGLPRPILVRPYPRSSSTSVETNVMFLGQTCIP